MKRLQATILGILAVVCIAVSTARLTAQDVVKANFEVLTSGPLHEAFARPILFGGIGVDYVASAPPQFIDELPPPQRPSGYSEWISGYWSYDGQSQSWIWVSGTWRVPPPGYTWVTGYWATSARGWRHVSGYWAQASTENTEIDYLPAPPEPIDASPVGTGASADAIWVSGNWTWTGSNYAWRDGYWVQGRDDWVWVPASYTWTPYGHVFQDAYWDHTLDRRGLLFAPVAFRPGVALAAGFSFSPGFAINVGLFSDSLFVRPFSDHYYYGDYYASTWWDSGVYPAFSFHLSRYGYDPLFAHASWQWGRNDPRWLDQRRSRFMNLQTHAEARPPRTLDEQRRRPYVRPGATEGETAPVAIASKDIAEAKITPLKIETVPESGRDAVRERVKQRDQARSERLKLEGQDRPAAEPTKPRKVKVPKELLPGAADAAKQRVIVPDRPQIPKVEERRPTDAPKVQRKLAEPPRPAPPKRRDVPNADDDKDPAGGKKPDGGKPPAKPQPGSNDDKKPEGDKPKPKPDHGNGEHGSR